ncbi:MAG: serine/threonine protein kinase, partial [Bacteroidetes bacterium]
SYLFAHSFFFFGVIVNVITIELGNFVSYVNLGDMGMVIQQIFFAVGLAEKMNLLHEEREAVQAELIKQLEQNDHLNRDLNHKLEIKVREKTLELEEALQDIQQMNDELHITLDIVREQKHRIEQQSRDIKDSIRYASRIQRSILPSLDLLNSFLPQNFVLFKPKDIVSGDFYWFAQKGNKIIIAAADCTGHGVPGAFMSTIGNDSLNKNIEFLGIISPELILNELHKDIRNTLKQGSEMEAKDGMDIAICVIDTEQHFLEYSGAMNPLYYIQNNELNIIRGTRLPIGGAQKEGKRVFEKHTIDLNLPTTFYIFSDGYQDQFGGIEGRKLMSKKFREVLISIQDLKMTQQKEFLEDYFAKWKGNHEQIDDILVIGIRLD